MKQTIKSINPSNGQLIGEVTITTHTQLNDIVSQAKAAWPTWRDTSLVARVEIVSQAFESLIPQQRDLATLMSM